MNRQWSIILVVLILVAVAMLALAGTPPRVVYKNNPETINEEVAAIYAGMSPITAFRLNAYANDTTITLAHNYGDTSGYVAFVTHASGVSPNPFIVTNVSGNEIRLVQSGAATHKVINVMTIARGVWGR